MIITIVVAAAVIVLMIFINNTVVIVVVVIIMLLLCLTIMIIKNTILKFTCTFEFYKLNNFLYDDLEMQFKPFYTIIRTEHKDKNINEKKIINAYLLLKYNKIIISDSK
jgi:uncharacterized protein (DUF58 family)